MYFLTLPQVGESGCGRAVNESASLRFPDANSTDWPAADGQRQPAALDAQHHRQIGS